MTREPVDLDAIERRAIIAAHDTECDANCGSDVSTYPSLSKAERAVLEVGRAAMAEARAETAEAIAQAIGGAMLNAPNSPIGWLSGMDAARRLARQHADGGSDD